METDIDNAVRQAKQARQDGAQHGESCLGWEHNVDTKPLGMKHLGMALAEEGFRLRIKNDARAAVAKLFACWGDEPPEP